MVRSLALGVVVGLVVAIGLSTVRAAVLPEPWTGVSYAGASEVGTAFTYQGRLTDGGSPATGSYDLTFALFDASENGAQIGPRLTKEDVTITGGLFTVSLDFGSEAFAGQPRWIEIGVRPGSSNGSFTILQPRQQLSAVPYALYSTDAGQALTATTALTATNVAWTGIVGMPSGFADGSDDNTTYTVGAGLVMTGTQLAIDPSVVQRRVSQECPPGSSIRSIDSTGAVTCQTDSTGGTITGVQAGSGLTGGGTEGDVTVSVSFGGNGNATTVARSDHRHDDAYQGKYRRTVIVSPTGDAVQNGAALLDALDGITDASASNPYLLRIEPGIFDLGSQSLTMKPFVDVEGSGEGMTTIRASGGSQHPTIIGASNTELRWLTVQQNGASEKAIGIQLHSVSTRLSRVTVAVANAPETVGIEISDASPALTEVSVSATGAVTATAVAISNGAPIIRTSTLTAVDAPTARAMYVGSAGAPTIYHSLLSGTGTGGYGMYADGGGGERSIDFFWSQITGEANTFWIGAGYMVNVAYSQVDGGRTQNGGTLKCFMSFTTSFTTAGASC